MNQVSDILALADQALSQNVDAVLATVVRTEGSAYRRPGAMMLICADGRSVGMVSGGCLERHLIERAFWLTRNGAWVQVYNTGSAADTDRRPARFGAAHLSFIDPLQALFMTDSDDLDGRDGFDKSHFEANAEDSELNSHLSNQTHDPIEANYDNYEDEDNDEEESYDSMSFGLGCHGSIHVLFERLSTAKAFLATLKSVRNAEQPVGVATLLAMTPTTVNDSSFDIDHTKPKNESGELTCGARFSLTPSSAEISLLNDVPLRLLSELNRPKNSSLLQQLQVAIDGLRLKSGAKARYQHIHYSDEQFSYDWLVQYLIPPIHLVICGAGNDAVPLVKLAKMLDWRISIIDSRSHYATRARFMDADLVQVVALDDQETLQRLSKGAAVALMSHSLTQDRARLKALLPLPNHHWAYLGQLGPRYRTERLINEIAQSLPNPAILRQGITRLQFPIGYKLGGDGPEALALGIIAQISAVMYEQDTVSPDLVAESLPLSAGAAAF